MTYQRTPGTPTALPPAGSAGGDLSGSFPNPVVTSPTVIRVTADGTTDAGPAIQAVLDALPSSARSLDVIVEGLTKGSIFINTAVQIKTSNTRLRFRAPLVFGDLAATSGYLSIIGTQAGSTTVSSGATRGSSQVVVASATGFAVGQLVHFTDTDTSGGSAAGDKAEMAEVVDISGTTIMLDHPLYHDYTGTITLARIADIQNSGFEDAYITWSAQQPQGVYFGIMFERVRNCYVRNVHARGTTSNSWSREMFRINLSYRCDTTNCSASNAWTYDTAASYSYGFDCHRSTACSYDRIWTSNLRHGFTVEKGSAGISLSQGKFYNVLATGIDFHGNWTRDSIVANCLATASGTRNSQDTTRHGFLAGNSTFIKGCRNLTFNACTAAGFIAYTPSGGGAGTGTSYGFGVVDGTTNIRFQGCRVIDSQHGIYIKSLVGEPITNVSVVGCEFVNIGAASGSAIPINVQAGAAPGDVLGLVIENNEFIGCDSATSIRVYGTSGNQINDVVIANNTWSRSTFKASNYVLDLQYIDDCSVISNRFLATRRGIVALSCPRLVVSGNKFVKLSDVNEAFSDAGGNTNMVMRANDYIGYLPTANPTITSTGAYFESGVAPAEKFGPSDWGGIAESASRVEVSSSTALATAGTVYVLKVKLTAAASVTGIVTQVTTAGSSLTSSQCFAGIYQNGSLLGATADQSGVWNSSGVKRMTISGGPIAVAAGYAYVAFLFNGTTGPTIARGNGNALINDGLANGTYRFATADTGRTTLPSTLGAMTALSVSYYAGLY